jgi:hypothetical protein
MITRTPECNCLHCGYTLDATGPTSNEEQSPLSPGDLVLCIRCGAVMMFADDLTVRGMSTEEMDKLCSDRETMNHLARQVKLMQKLN